MRVSKVREAVEKCNPQFDGMSVGAAALQSTWQYVSKFKLCVPCDEAGSELHVYSEPAQACAQQTCTDVFRLLLTRGLNENSQSTHQDWACKSGWWVRTFDTKSDSVFDSWYPHGENQLL